MLLNPLCGTAHIKQNSRKDAERQQEVPTETVGTSR